MKAKMQTFIRPFDCLSGLRSGLAATVFFSGLAGGAVALADDDGPLLRPGNLLLSRVIYDNNPSTIAPGTALPPDCVSSCAVATNDGSYPNVWNNALIDGSFGITAKIVLDQLRPTGGLVNSLEVPNSSQRRVRSESDQMVGSFSSKSEVALNLSTDHRFVTFMGYLAPIDAVDVSNSNTPGVVDPTNPVSEQNYRVVAQLDRDGEFRFTKTNAYSGNNGRAAILNDQHGANILYTVGNAGNGANPQPNGVIVGASAQYLTAERTPLASQNPGLPTPVGSFSITQLSLKADKVGKDTNFRGLAIFDNVVYSTKGSGGNGINTVYFIDTSGFDGSGKPLACPNGVGVPAASASLPASPIIYDATALQTKGVVPSATCASSRASPPRSRARRLSRLGSGLPTPRRFTYRTKVTARPPSMPAPAGTRMPPSRPRQGCRSGSSTTAWVHGSWRMCCRQAWGWAFRTPWPATRPATIPRPDFHGHPRPMVSAISWAA